MSLSLQAIICLLYTSDAADDSLRVDLGGRRIIKKTSKKTNPFSNICSELFDTINERSINPLEKSYTNHLLTKGSNTILKKMGEETAEFIMACKDNDKDEIANEAADIIYHLQVALSLIHI